MGEDKQPAVVCCIPQPAPPVSEDPTPEACPKCGGPITFGYGFAAGGLGSYSMCLGEKDPECDWMLKTSEDTGE